MKDILEGLNPKQREAVTTVQGPLLVIAGAGTGKTTVLMRRIAYLIEVMRVPSRQILAVTFTEKAAEEVKNRVEETIGTPGEDLWVSTIHAFCAKILRHHADRLGFPKEFQQFDEVDEWIFLRRLLPELKLDYFLELADPYRVIYEFVRFISRAKDELILPDEYAEYAQKELQTFERNHKLMYSEIAPFLRADKYINSRPSIAEHLQQNEWLSLKEAGLELKKKLEIGDIYRHYQEAMKNDVRGMARKVSGKIEAALGR